MNNSFLRHKSVTSLVYAAMLTAIAIVFPQIFHFTGIPNAGQMFLPMHIPILVCGLWLGPFYGGAAGLIAPLVSCLLTQMPAPAKMPFMMIELAVYGMICGICYRMTPIGKMRFGTHFSLWIGMVFGRCVYALTLTVATYLLGLKAGNALAVVSSTLTGIIGIVIQLIIVPPLVRLLEKKLHFPK